MAANDKKSPNFFIRLVGGGVKPWSVPTRRLTQILNAIQRLVDQKGEDEVDTAEDNEIQGIDEVTGSIEGADSSVMPLPIAEAPSLRLVSLRAASAGYGIAASDPTTVLDALRIAGSQIDAPEEADWRPSTLSSIRDISDAARSLGVQVEIRAIRDGRPSSVIAKISPASFTEISQIAMVHGTSSVLGVVERVGGVTTKHCGLHVSSQKKMIYCQVDSEKIVKEMGKYLFQSILVTGTVTWLKRTWEIKTIKISDFEPPKGPDFLDTLQRMNRAGGSAWDKVRDPDKRLAEIRGA